MGVGVAEVYKSKKYKGIYQRKNGTWFYRLKRVVDGKAVYYQDGGFDTELEAYRGYMEFLYSEEYQENYNEIITPVTFKRAFEVFLEEKVNSESSRKKYQGLYDAHLYIWADRIMAELRDSELDVFLLKISLKERIITRGTGANKKEVKKKYKESYIYDIRELLSQLFQTALEKGYIHQNIFFRFSRKPYKLRVMSLFSGIGAPEQALKNLGIDYELVNYCEIDRKASRAYSLLHGVPEDKNLHDVTKMATPSWHNFPNFDVLIFGFPCQDVSRQGNKAGLKRDNGELTRSGLFFEAMRIAEHELPKFIIVENVAAIAEKNHKEDFALITEEMEKAGYAIYTAILNSKNFGVPQNRERFFGILIRKDLKVDFQFPEPKPLSVRAEDWFEKDVAEEYYATPKQLQRINSVETFKPNFRRDYITCITTRWGSPSTINQTFVIDEKGTRCLSSEELMRFQGFTREQGKILRENGFSKNQVGKLVGNSITVPVIQAIIEQFIKGL